MKRNLILMTLLVISSLMVAPALAETQNKTTSPVFVAAAEETASTAIATEATGSSQKSLSGK